MLLSNNREHLREMYYNTWHKYLANQTLEPMEAIILDILLMHPEYHYLFASREALLQDFPPELGQSNPFLHMGLHIALYEQISTNRPQGIALLYNEKLTKWGSRHEVEHKMMDVLAQILWEAQHFDHHLDEQNYLEKLKNL